MLLDLVVLVNLLATSTNNKPLVDLHAPVQAAKHYNSISYFVDDLYYLNSFKLTVASSSVKILQNY